MNEELLSALNRIVANATPLVIASLGETITERAGVINLSLDGSIVLSALVGFVAALASQSAVVGIAAAMICGGLIALIIALASIELKQDQVAVGFILTLLAADLAQRRRPRAAQQRALVHEAGDEARQLLVAVVLAHGRPLQRAIAVPFVQSEAKDPERGRPARISSSPTQLGRCPEGAEGSPRGPCNRDHVGSPSGLRPPSPRQGVGKA